MITNDMRVRVLNEREFEERKDDFSSYEKEDLKESLGKVGIVTNYKFGFFKIKTEDGTFLRDRDGYEMLFNKNYVMVVEDDLKVGDKVYIALDLSRDREYSILTVPKSMMELVGKEVTVKEITKEGIITLEEYDSFVVERDMLFTKKQLDEYKKKEEENKLLSKLYNVGNKVLISHEMSKDTKYKHMTCKSSMTKYRNEVATILEVKAKDGYYEYRIDLDEKNNIWSNEVFIDLSQYNKIFNTQTFSKKRIAIHLANKEEIYKFVDYINRLRITWSEGSKVTKTQFKDETELYVTLYNRGEENVLTFDTKEYFEENQFEIEEYGKIFFNNEVAKVKRLIVNSTTEQITELYIKERGIHVGDMYYKESLNNEDFRGWYLVTKNCSIGLNTKLKGAWSDISEDFKRKDVKKYIFFDEKFSSNSQLSKFFNTLDENILEDLIKEVC